MGVRDRLAVMALRWLGNEKALAFMRNTWDGYDPTYTAPGFANMVEHGYRKNELIFACIATTADSASQVSLKVHSTRTTAVRDDHPLAKLIQSPNPFMTESDFWASVVVYQKLAGRAFYEKERNRSGKVIALWPLRPDWMEIIPSRETMIAGYRYGPPTMAENQRVRLDVNDVLDFPLFDPLDNLHGHSPVAVAARIGDVDNSTTDFLKLFMEKGGTPPGLLKTQQRISEADVAVIRRMWRERYGGIGGWIDPAVLGQDVSYEKIGSSLKEMGFDMLDARSGERICMVLRVPPIMVGAKVGLDAATYSNYETAEKAWWRNTLRPLYRNFEDVFNNGLMPEFGGDIYLKWDWSQVDALQEDLQRRWDRALNGVGRGVLTRNQALIEMGMEPVGPAGDVYLLPITLVEVPARTPRRSGTAAAIPDHTAANEPDHPAKAQQPPGERAEQEQVMQTDLAEFFGGQLERIRTEVEATYGTRS